MFRDRELYLEIAAAEEEVDLGVLGFFKILEGFVDIVEVAMHAPFHCYLHPFLTSDFYPSQFQIGNTGTRVLSKP